MDPVRNARLAGAFGDPFGEGRMDLDGRNPGIRQRLRQGEGRAAVPCTQVEHPSDGIAVRHGIERTQRRGVVARRALRQRPEHLVYGVV